MGFAFVAFAGDITCDFENENWADGECNWRFDFFSSDVFMRTSAQSSDELALKKRWKYGEFTTDDDSFRFDNVKQRVFFFFR